MVDKCCIVAKGRTAKVSSVVNKGWNDTKTSTTMSVSFWLKCQMDILKKKIFLGQSRIFLLFEYFSMSRILEHTQETLLLC